MSDVFISYTQHDFAIVSEIAAALESVDISTWYYSRDQLPGAQYPTRINQEIKDAGCLLLVVSPATLQRDFQVNKEIFCAADSDKRIVPILLGVSFETFRDVREGSWYFHSGASVCVVVEPENLSSVLPRICRGIMEVLKEEAGREFPDYLYKRLDSAESDKLDLSQPIDGVDIEFDPLSLPDVDEPVESEIDDATTIELGVENSGQGKRAARTSDVVAEPSALTFDVFISAKSEDAELAIKVYEYLTGKGFGVFYSHFSLPRLGSTRYREVIDSAIDACQHFVMVASSRQNLDSGWVKAELDLFLCELRAGRKSGNLCTVVSGELTIDQLPISLRNQEVFELNESSFERLSQFLAKPVSRADVPPTTPKQVRETPTAVPTDSVNDVAPVPPNADHTPAAAPPAAVTVTPGAQSQVAPVASSKVAPVVQPVEPERMTPVGMVNHTATDNTPDVAHVSKVEKPVVPEPAKRRAKYDIREVLDTLNGLSVLLTESADYHSDQQVRQQLEDCGLFAYRVRAKLMERPNRYAALSEQDETRVESVADYLNELIQWWRTTYGADRKRILWRDDSLNRWESSLRGKKGFCNLIANTILKTRGS